MNSIIEVKPKYIKKHNAAIRSYSEMSLLQRKLANTLLYNAYHELEKTNFHEISISKLLALLCMKTNDYKKLKEAILKLMSTVIEWNVLRKSENKNTVEVSKMDESWKACTMLSSVEINGTTIKYEYSNILREMLYHPSFYSKINLNIQNKFRSLYSLSLYENCMSYMNCGSSGWLAFAIFRRLMGVNEQEYKEFRDFNKRVLKPAIAEVNEKSEIEVNFEIRREARIPTYIKLIVSRKFEAPSKVPKILNVNDSAKDKLLSYGFSKNDIQDAVEKYSEKKILEKVELIEGTKNNINSPVAFLKAALKNDYKKSGLVYKKINVDFEKDKERRDRKEFLKNEYKKYVDEIIRTWVFHLNEEEKRVLIISVEKHCESSGLPTCKRARYKLRNEKFIADSDVFFSIKNFIFSIQDKSNVEFQLPNILSMAIFAEENF